jgi:uncharacterized protein (DUF924 family)
VTSADTAYGDVLSFWFEELEPSQWWVKDEQLDRIVGSRFSQLHASATRCELYEWRATPEGRLAEIIVLDQFSRNLFRGLVESFAQDSLALALAQEAVSAGADRALRSPATDFMYMPFMHSESLLIHDVALRLFENNGVQSTLQFELKHRAIIERFGRYPHRNEILGRPSTAAEIEFLKQPNAGF